MKAAITFLVCLPFMGLARAAMVAGVTLLLQFAFAED